MSKKFLIIVILFICFSVGYLSAQKTEPRIFTIQELKYDFNYLRLNLQNKHPNLYLYTLKNDLDKIFDSLNTSISNPMTELEFYKHITILSSVIKDGHTIILPNQKTMDYYNSYEKFIPYKFILRDNKLFADMVYTDYHSISSGTEIISINKVASAKIIEDLVKRQVRDGNNTTYPIWILNNYFRSYYSFIVGHPNEYIIEYKEKETVKTTTINALTNDSIFYFKNINYPTFTKTKKPNEGITLQFSENNTYATLTIKDFHKGTLKKEYKQDFKKVISSFFNQINKSKTNNLILDLRDNQGGDITFGVYLLSHLLDQPFTIVQSYSKVNNKKGGYELKKTNGQSLGIHKPSKNVFKGKLFVLINGGSFSNSGIVASCLKRNNRAIFIGEETGGNNKVLAGYTKNYSLPNTKVSIQIPTKQFLLDDTLPLTGRGTIPDFSIQQDFSPEKDKVMKFTIEKITTEK